EEVAGKLREVLRTPLGATVFAPGPPVSLDADYIVFAAQGLNLPERDHLMNPHLARRLLPEQILGQALLYLVTAVTRAVTWKTVRRFSLGVLDEVWALTRTVEGQALIEEQIHDGPSTTPPWSSPATTPKETSRTSTSAPSSRCGLAFALTTGARRGAS